MLKSFFLFFWWLPLTVCACSTQATSGVHGEGGAAASSSGGGHPGSTGSQEPVTSGAGGAAAGGGAPVAVCGALGDQLALGAGVAWSVELDGVLSFNGDDDKSFELHGHDATGAVYIEAKGLSCAGAPPDAALHQYRVAADGSVSGFALQVWPGYSSEYPFYLPAITAPEDTYLFSRSLAKVGPDGAVLWRHTLARSVVEGVFGASATGVVACSGTTCSAFTQAGASIWTKTVRAVDSSGCTNPAYEPSPCTSEVDGAVLMGDGTVALAGTSDVAAPFDFGQGELHGGFAVVLEADGSLRSQTSFGDGARIFAGHLGAPTLVRQHADGTYTYDRLAADGAWSPILHVGSTSITGLDAAGNVAWSRPATVAPDAFVLSAGDHLVVADRDGEGVLELDAQSGAVERDVSKLFPFAASDTQHTVAFIDLDAAGRMTITAERQGPCSTTCQGGNHYSYPQYVYAAGFAAP